VKCLRATKADWELSGAATFLEDLIDACVMECYFRAHMAERDLLFHNTVAQILEKTHTKPRRRETQKGFPIS
jgi:hypothetical protein